MSATQSRTVKQLLYLLVDRESLEAQAKSAHRKVTGPAERYTLSGHYAVLGCQYQAQAMEVTERIVDIAGVDRLRVLCEANGERLDSTRVRQMRGQWCLATDRRLDDADALTVEEFARQVTKLRKGQGGEELEEKALRVKNWEDLAIGIDEHGSYWAVTPTPVIGGIFPMARAQKLVLEGNRWSALLRTFAKAAEPAKERRDVLCRDLGLLAPSSSVARDSRVHPKANHAAVREELPNQGSTLSKRLNLLLSDLRRELTGIVDGPKGRRGCCLATMGQYIHSRFAVRYLFRQDNGQMSFGERVRGQQ
jgi:hypothetical protein